MRFREDGGPAGKRREKNGVTVVKISAIEVSGIYPRCRRSSRHATEYSDMPMSLHEIRTYLRSGFDVGIYVDGWTKPWACFLDENDQLRARCSTSRKVLPLVGYDRTQRRRKDGK